MHKAETLGGATYTMRSDTCAVHFIETKIAKPVSTATHSTFKNILFLRRELATTNRAFVPTNVYAFPRAKGAIGVPEIIVPDGLKIVCDQEAWDFAENRGLLRVIMSYTALASKSFQLASSPSCHFKHDPENEDEYLTIRLEVTGEIENILDAEDAFRSRVSGLMSGEELYLIRRFCVID